MSFGPSSLRIWPVTPDWSTPVTERLAFGTDVAHASATAVSSHVSYRVGPRRSFGFEVYARLPSPAAFAHGAPLLAKDIGLIAAILPDDPGAEALRRAAEPFLTLATAGSAT